MAVKDGLPSTDFSRMNREYIKAVAEGGSGGLPEITEADEGKVLTVESGEAAWATAGGGGGALDSAYFFVETEENPDADDPVWTMRTVATAKEILDAADAGKILIRGPFESFSCGNAGQGKYYLSITSITPAPADSVIYVDISYFERVDAADIETAHFIINGDSLFQQWTVEMTPAE